MPRKRNEERRNGKGGGGTPPGAFWSGTIAFGLVSVPVTLFVATRPGGVSLRMVDRDGTPLSRRYVCTREERVLSRDEIVRGYEVEPDRYVVVSDDELAQLAPEKSREIDLRRFVPRAEIDPTLFDRAYFLAPRQDSTKAYRLLARAMEEQDRVGIATFVMRGKEYLVAILAERGILRAETLRFPEEARSPEDVALPEREAADAERASTFREEIAALAEDELDRADLSGRRDRRLMSLVEAKLEERDDVVEAAAEAETDEEAPVDLMEVLKRSLAGRGGDGEGRGADGESSAGEGNGAERRSGNGEALAEQSKAELYERAKERDIPGRSSMNKDELIEALRA